MVATQPKQSPGMEQSFSAITVSQCSLLFVHRAAEQGALSQLVKIQTLTQHDVLLLVLLVLVHVRRKTAKQHLRPAKSVRL